MKRMDTNENTTKLVFSKGHGLFKHVDEDIDSRKAERTNLLSKKKKLVWEDEEDVDRKIPNKLKKYAAENGSDSYEAILHRRFRRHEDPKWSLVAEKTKKYVHSDHDVDETMRCGNMLSKKGSSLPKNIIDIERVQHLNIETRMEGQYINAVEFHPTATVALIAGSSGIASIVRVDGVTNGKLQTVQFKDFQIACARFSVDGEHFLVGSKFSRLIHDYDMIQGKITDFYLHPGLGPLSTMRFVMSPDGRLMVVIGKYGKIHVLSAITKEWIGDLKMNSKVMSVTFNSSGGRLFSIDDTGEIFEWDMTTRTFSGKFLDDRCTGGTCVVASPNDQLLGVGTVSGIVNVFEMPLSGPPVKEVKNLVTRIKDAKFNCTTEIMAVASHEKENAVKLIHFPSMTVFSNFPFLSYSLSKPCVLNFSPSSGFFAIGNNRGTVYLYRLKHYKNY